MADQASDQIRICDFGNALKLTPNEALYCTYGTPEFIAPEIVNQTPVSIATDIWYKDVCDVSSFFNSFFYILVYILILVFF